MPPSPQGCSALLLDCDVSSATGDGVGIEGGAPTLQRCAVHACARQGVAVFGDLLGEEGCAASISDCTLSDNGACGLLVRDGARPTVQRCTVSGNGEWGLRLLDAGGRYEDNDFVANRAGSVAYALPFEEVDTARLILQNRCDRPVHYLKPR